MSDEKVVSILRQQHKSLDETVHGLAKETARIKDIALNNQEAIGVLKNDMTVVKARLNVLEHKVDEGFAKVDERFSQVDERFDKMEGRFNKMEERFDQLELLIRQLLPNTTK